MNERIAALYRARPRNRGLRISLWGLGLFTLFSWFSGEIAVFELFDAKRAGNLQRFLAQDAMPYPLREDGFSVGGFVDYVMGVLAENGWSGMLATLWISVLAIVLAGILAVALVPFASRTLACSEPFMTSAPRSSLGWRVVTTLTRGAFVFLRAIPEYIWAFLFLAVLGPSAWPAVIALALHNAGILGRLGADTVENLERGPLRSLAMLGASRSQLASTAILPLALPRFLLYFFYRFETCVREATVLGMLGVVSLGYWIQDARSRQFYDDMLVLVALGAVLVLIGDLLSYIARGYIRRAV